MTDYRSDPNEFCMDGHVHSSPANIEPVIASARTKGLDAIVLTDMNHTDTFDTLDVSRSGNRSLILPPDYFITKLGETTILVDIPKDEYNQLIIEKGEEIRTDRGDILAWGLEKKVEGGRPITYTLLRIFEQGAIAGFPHIDARIFNGVGEEKLYELLKLSNMMQESESLDLRENPLFLETNGQCDPRLDIIHHDSDASRLANYWGFALFANSDAHCNYYFQARNVGKYYSAIPKGLINPLVFKESLKEVILYHRNQIKIGGEKNNFLSTGCWMTEMKIRQLLSKLSKH